jgi:filamentous hemagglutinin
LSFTATGPDIGSIAGGNINGGVNGSQGKGSRAWVTQQSGLVAEKELDVRVEKNTDLKGGIIASKSGDLTLDTGTLTFSDIEDHDKQRNTGGGVNVGIGIDKNGNVGTPGGSVEFTDAKKDKEQITRATVGEGTLTIRDEADQKALEDSGKTENVASLNRDLDKAQEITRDEESYIGVYVSDTAVREVVKGMEVVGKSLGRAFEALGSKLADKGELSADELETAKKVADALDAGTLDIKGFLTCSTQQSFSIWNLFISPAYASSGCPLYDSNGKLIAELTPREREACVQMLTGLMEEYVDKFLTDDEVELSESVKSFADGLREIGSDKNLVALAQSLGMASGFLREVILSRLMSKEAYRQLQEGFKEVAKGGELSKEAANKVIDKLAAERGLSTQDVKDLKLITGVTLAVAIGAGTKLTGLRYKKILFNGRPTITDGTYTVNPRSMDKHMPGKALSGKSVFSSKVDPYQTTLDAARHADKHKLWDADGKARVPTQGIVGTHGRTGQATTFINVYRKQGGALHATPASPEK